MTFSLLTMLFIVSVTSAFGAERRIEIDFSSEVMARKGDAELTFLETHALLEGIPDRRTADFLESPDRFTQFLSSTLVTRAMSNNALQAGLLTESQVAARVYVVAMEELARIDQEKYVEDRVLDDYTQQARERFLANRDRFTKPATATFDQILLISGHDSGGGSVEQRVKTIYREFQEGRTFQALVKEYSEDPSASKNMGRFTEVRLSRLEPDFGNGIREAEQGELVTIKSSYGTHVVLVHRFIPERQAEFADVEQRLKTQAREEHEQRILQSYADELAEQKLEIEDGGVEQLLRQYDVEWSTE